MSRLPAPPVRQQAAALPWLLLAAGAWAYHNSLSGPFIYDDLPAIVENPHLRRLWPLWEAMSAPTASPVDGRPVVSLTLAINYALGGLRVWGYHVVNLILHLLSGLVLFGLLHRTLAGERLRPRFGNEARWLAGSIALVWLVHPLLTESVNYVIQRSELLMGLWLLLTLYAVVRCAHATSGGRWTAVAIASCATGMASKEVMIGAPLLALLYDCTFLGGSFREALRQRRRLYLGLAATWLILAACVLTSTHQQVAGFGFVRLTPWNYAVTQLDILSYYLRLAVWPYPLVVDYGDWPIAQGLTEVWPSAVAIFGSLGWTLWALARRHPAGFLGAWFFLILGPTSSVLPILTEVAAERRMYLPLCAVVVVIVLGVWDVLQRLGVREAVRRTLFLGFVAVIVSILSVLTLRRNEDYRTARRIWSDAVAKRPGNPRAYNNLGEAFLWEGNLDEAAVQYREALRLWPDYVEAHSNLCLVLARQGALEQALAHCRQALRLDPDFADAHNNTGLIRLAQDRVSDAVASFQRALRLRPDHVKAHNNLGVALARQGKREEAVAQFQQALRLNPDYTKARDNLRTMSVE